MAQVEIAREGRVLVVAMNRPEKKNALTLAMYDAMADALRGADEDASVRAVLIRGEGDAFCAGNDLADFMRSPPAGEDSPVFRFMLAVLESQKPLVAAVHGPAVGIGTTLLPHCDLVYAAADARLSTPFVKLGLVPEFASSLILPRQIGLPRATRLLILGEAMSAQEGLAAGLIGEVVPRHALRATALAGAARLAALPPQAVRQSRALLRRADRDEVLAALRAEAAIFLERLASPETAEAVSAFFQKRPPDFDQFDQPA